MTATGCICVVWIGVDASAICSTTSSRVWASSPLRDSESNTCRARFFLREFVPCIEAGAAESVRRGLRLGVVGTSVSSCSAASSLAVVETDALSIDKRDKISSRVDALIGRTEKREESAVARMVDVRVEPLEGVEAVAAGGGT